ncbi:MAG: hypothetical protein H6Q14_1278 [Bacteroidetes bacterium]|nr:hypothetical protein [Bacteroidota bacterium]
MKRFYYRIFKLKYMKMKLKLLLLFALFPIFSYAQYLKFSTGPSFSSMKKNDNSALQKNRTGVNFQVGLDYFEHRFYSISSELGYIQTGGKDNILLVGDDDSRKDISLKLSNIHMNSTFRFKIDTKNKLNLFIGCGPKLDYQFSPKYDSNINEISYYEFPKNKLLFGLKMEAGVQYELKNSKLGIECSNIQNFTKSNSFLKNSYNLIDFVFALRIY